MRQPRSTSPRGLAALSALLFGLASAFSIATDGQAQGCTTRATNERPLAVFDRPPEASTGRGFVYGAQILELPAKSTVYLCKDITVGFGLVSERWTQVAVWLPEKRWLYGWVRESGLAKLAAVPAQKPAPLKIVAQAHAANAPSPDATTRPRSAPLPSSAGAPAGQLPGDSSGASGYTVPEGAPPPAPPASAEDFRLTSESIWFQVQFVFLLTVAVLLGILAQGMYTLLGTEKPLSARGKLKLFVRPLLILPIVMLVFLGTVDLNISQWKQALLIGLLAFQAGFCWEKALERSPG